MTRGRVAGGRGQVQQSLEDFLRILAFMLRAAGNQEGVSHPGHISEDDRLYYGSKSKALGRTGRETNSKATAAFRQESAEAGLEGAKEIEMVRD